MKLEKIITLANKNVKLRFLAMERSLRASGCNLPLWVIPYNNDKFELPENATWWEIPELTSWLDKNNAHRMMRKYQCMLTTNYQFVDTDIIFLLNPEIILLPYQGFVTSCGHWRNTAGTTTTESEKYLYDKTTKWPKYVFNAGQFACDRILYNFDDLRSICENPANINTCLHFPFHDQPGLNLLVNKTDIAITNVLLISNMESTWAGEYTGEYEKYWTEEFKKPYIIHWAGCEMDINRPIDQLFLNYLTKTEKEEWDASLKNKKESISRRIGKRLSKFKNGLKTMIS